MRDATAEPVPGCEACDLLAGARPFPGGRVHETPLWVVEHCVGPLGVGTLLLKPRRHCLHVGALTPDEAAALGPLLQRTAACVQELNEAEQVYTCLWSHAGWTPQHLHWVVQPAGAAQREFSALPGPTLQVAMFARGEEPDPEAVAAFCERARAWPGWTVP